jgi:excisionase family DNA binding protein
MWSIDEVADFLNVSKDTIYGWRKTGYGPPASKIGKHLRWRPQDVAAWVERLR